MLSEVMKHVQHRELSRAVDFSVPPNAWVVFYFWKCCVKSRLSKATSDNTKLTSLGLGERYWKDVNDQFLDQGAAVIVVSHGLELLQSTTQYKAMLHSLQSLPKYEKHDWHRMVPPIVSHKYCLVLYFKLTSAKSFTFLGSETKSINFPAFAESSSPENLLWSGVNLSVIPRPCTTLMLHSVWHGEPCVNVLFDRVCILNHLKARKQLQWNLFFELELGNRLRWL